MPLAPKTVRIFTRQLRREIPHMGHVLSGETFVIIAKNPSANDVLLALPDRDQWASCHMTWSKKRELLPWPLTTVADSLAELMFQR